MLECTQRYTHPLSHSCLNTHRLSSCTFHIFNFSLTLPLSLLRTLSSSHSPNSHKHCPLSLFCTHVLEGVPNASTSLLSHAPPKHGELQASSRYARTPSRRLCARTFISGCLAPRQQTHDNWGELLQFHYLLQTGVESWGCGCVDCDTFIV